jgi:hypothetical protein
VPWPLVQHPRSLSDGQSDARPVLDGLREDLACLVEIVARARPAQHCVTLSRVARPGRGQRRQGRPGGGCFTLRPRPDRAMRQIAGSFAQYDKARLVPRGPRPQES